LKNELKTYSIKKESTTLLKNRPLDKTCIFSFTSEYKQLQHFYVKKEYESEAKKLLNAYITKDGNIKNLDDFESLKTIFCDSGIKNYVWIDKRQFWISLSYMLSIQR
jgi:hypothetical protein